ncbi:MAG: hypothetical protein KC442_23865 [Thermomicrobiales bacterium]|nr:hypothetical protein [Thermomicrobiales bacterium]
MVRTEPLVIHIDPESELGRALEDSDQEIVLMRAGKKLYVSRKSSDPWADYDPEAVHRALRDIAGLITPEEAEKRIEQLYRWREPSSRPLTRP